MVTEKVKADIEEALSRATMLQGDDPPVIIVVPRSQASDLLALPARPPVEGAADIGGDPAQGIEHPAPILFFDAFEITTTANFRPTGEEKVLDLRGARNWSFDIQNDHNQAVTVELIGGSDRTPDGMGLLGLSALIPANTTEPIATDIWLPFMSIQVSYTVGPASGTLTARGFRQLFAR